MQASSTQAQRVSTVALVRDPNPVLALATPLRTSHAVAELLCASITVIYIADNWFQTYLDSIPGAYYDGNNTGLIVIPFESVPFMKPFTFYVAGMYTRPIPLHPNAG